MDHPFITEASFSAANPASYSLTEIWPFSAGTTGEMGSSSGLGLRIGNLGSGFGERDGSVEESTVTEQSGAAGGNGRKRKDFSFEDETSNLVSTITSSGGNVLNDSTAKQRKIEQFVNENNSSKAGGEASSSEHNKQVQESCKPPEPPKQDYIHVRARRGQATDSHSLAERARREKISERMKLLQDLVPGCNKIIGKAVVLDEIINYIQSLQRQVEFLSMKLETVNSRMNMNPMIEGFHPKDLGAQPFDANGMMFSSQATREYAQGSQPEWLHMQVGGSFQRAA